MWQRFKKPAPAWQMGLLYAVLLTLPLALYFRWLNFDIFTYGDWSYKHLDTLKDTLQLSSWIGNSGFGSFDELVWRAPFNLLFGLFAAAGLPINVSEKFIVFIPIALTSILAPYMLLHQITKQRLASVIGALFYATNTYFLAINPQGHQLLTLAANVLTIAFALFIKALDSNRQGTYIGAALLLWLASIIDFRLFYIGGILFGAYLLYWRLIASGPKRMPLKPLAVFTAITILLQVSWLTVTLASGGSSSSDAVLHRSLFGSEYWDLASALTLHHPFWTGFTTSWFISNAVPLVFWLIPIGVCAALIIERKNTYVIFFAVVAVAGILLSKQTSEPFGGLYPFLFDHVPGFGAFRESTKFYYLVALGYTVILASLVVSLGRLRTHIRLGRTIFAGTLVLLIGLCLVNALPYVTGSMHKLLAPRTMPADYARLAKQLQASGDYYRTLWVPIAPRWSYYSSKHPRVNGTNLAAIMQRQAISIGNYNSPAEQIYMMIASPLFKQYLDTSSIRYIYVPLRDAANQDDFFPLYGDDRQFYIDALDKTSFLSRVDMGTKDVVVYQNKSYRPYITATANLFDVPEQTALEPLYRFMADGVAAPISFAIPGKKNTSTPANTAADIFDPLAPSAVTKGAVIRDITLDQPGTLHLTGNRPTISYTISGGVLHLQADHTQPLTVDGQLASTPGQIKSIGDIRLAATRNYLVWVNGQLIPLNPRAISRNLGSSSGGVLVLSTDQTNLIQNGSFESGPWQQAVGDCNAYDADPGLGMTVDDRTATDGKQSLELAASRHTACTLSNDMDVEGDRQYLVSFNYKAPNAKRITFGVTFDGQTQVQHIFTNSGTEEWRTAYQLITAPPTAQRLTLQLYGLPPANYSFDANVASTRYDQVVVTPVTIEQAYLVDQTANAQNLPIAAGKHQFVYTDPGITAENLIHNASLESGTWQRQAQACDDREGRRQVSATTSDMASDGHKSLELTAKGRVACTGPDGIAVTENTNYVLGFDHQSVSNNVASFSLSFNDRGRTSIGDTFATNQDWQTYTKIITVPAGATLARLKVYTTSSATAGITNTNRYDNFRLLAIPPVNDRFYLTTTANLQTPQHVTFRSHSQTKKTVAITGASGPFYLTMAESYSPGWRLTGQKQNTHGKLDGNLNAWYVDPAKLCAEYKKSCTRRADGSYDMRLSINYAPQRWFVAGLCVELATLVGVAGYALLLGRRTRRRST